MVAQLDSDLKSLTRKVDTITLDETLTKTTIDLEEKTSCTVVSTDKSTKTNSVLTITFLETKQFEKLKRLAQKKKANAERL